MKEVLIGEIMKERRLELGLTQEELCEGICEPITVSRLENGRQTPSRNRVNALLERLDLPTDRYYALLSKNELEIEALQKEMASCNVRFFQRTGEEKKLIRQMALETHRKLEAIIDKDDRISRQLILNSQVLLGKEDGPYSPEEKKAMLLEAIRLTAPSFDPEEIGRGLYTTDEMRVINQLAGAHSEAGEHMEAISIWNQLYKYIRKHFSGTMLSCRIYPTIVFNLANELDIVGQYKKAVEIAEVGKKACLDCGYYLSLPGLLSVMAESWHFLGEDERSRELYCQAYYTAEAIGDRRRMKYIRYDAGNYLGMEFKC